MSKSKPIGLSLWCAKVDEHYLRAESVDGVPKRYKKYQNSHESRFLRNGNITSIVSAKIINNNFLNNMLIIKTTHSLVRIFKTHQLVCFLNILSDD